VAPNINDVQRITGDNNRTLIGFKKWVVGNEVQSIEHCKVNFDKLKSLITDDTCVLRDLFERPVTMRNVSNFIFSTNNYDSIRIGTKDRRYFVLDVSDAQIGRVLEYFEPLQATFTDEFRTHLLNYFLRFDCKAVREFNPRRPVDTVLKLTIKEMCESVPEQFMEQFNWAGGKRGFTLDELWQKFMDWTDKMSIDRKYMGKSGVSFGMKIGRFVRVEKKKLSGRTTNVYFPKVEVVPAVPEAVTIEADDTDSDEVPNATIKTIKEVKPIKTPIKTPIKEEDKPAHDDEETIPLGSGDE
jgi:hypothetical protein